MNKQTHKILVGNMCGGAQNTGLTNPNFPKTLPAPLVAFKSTACLYRRSSGIKGQAPPISDI